MINTINTITTKYDPRKRGPIETKNREGVEMAQTNKSTIFKVLTDVQISHSNSCPIIQVYTTVLLCPIFTIIAILSQTSPTKSAVMTLT